MDAWINGGEIPLVDADGAISEFGEEWLRKVEEAECSS